MVPLSSVWIFAEWRLCTSLWVAGNIDAMVALRRRLCNRYRKRRAGQSVQLLVEYSTERAGYIK
jgi:hypothetical protein